MCDNARQQAPYRGPGLKTFEHAFEAEQGRQTYNVVPVHKLHTSCLKDVHTLPVRPILCHLFARPDRRVQSKAAGEGI